jgi:hypothetical protein
VRELKICLRRAAELPIYARRLVHHLAARRNETEVGDSPVLPDAAPQSARLR